MEGGFLAWAGPLDWLALGWFFVAWAGYGWFADRSRWASRGLLGASHHHRLQWARAILAREARVADAALVGNLMRSVSFYANLSIYIIAGLLALLGTLDQAIRFAADLPFAHESSRELWEVKLLLLLAVFVVAYFKFTWSLRQFNLLSIVIGASPVGAAGEEIERAVERLARLNSLAGDEFNSGIRAYYFGIAVVSWFVQPLLFVLVTTAIVVILYRRDFASAALAALLYEPPPLPGNPPRGGE